MMITPPDGERGEQSVVRHSEFFLCIRVAARQKRHHAGRVPAQVEPHPLFIEFLRAGCRYADRIDAIRH